MRRADLPVAGRWYLGMLLLLGAVSLISSNNVVYLMESLLIAGLVLSLVLAIRSARSVHADVRRRPIRANAESNDIAVIVNRSWLPAFCLEIEEWSEGKARRLAFVPYLK